MYKSLDYFNEQTALADKNFKQILDNLEAIKNSSYTNTNPNYNPEVFQLEKIKNEHSLLMNSSASFENNTEEFVSGKETYQVSLIGFIAFLTFLSYICIYK